VAFVLIGFMGAGKSTLAGRLARLRGTQAIDSDALLSERFGHSVARELDLRGEESFRAAEEEVMCGVLDGAGPREVIALGGGSVLSCRIRDALAGHLVALLDVDVQLAWERVHERDDGSERPLARDRDAFGALYAERRELYEEVAGARLLWAESASGEYPVLVGRGMLGGGEDVGSRLEAIWPLDRSRSRPFLVSDETVSALYGDRLGEVAGTVAIAPGEEHKTLASAERVWRELLGAGMTRSDHVVALGGGVVGDLAGFCAATYQRGVPVVHVPTTLVAQVDSAYGGKTGVDLPDAKNYVGAYHQPAGVLVDPDMLATLPHEELAAGWVEVLKTALIAGGALWERVGAAEGCESDERTILDCARTKLAIVAADERDGGARQALNLGHTVGHAIETVTGYGRYRHGEAVGLGLLAALRLSGAGELRAQVRELLGRRGLPVTLGGGEVDVDEIVAATARDKKRLGVGGVPFVLLSAPGEPRVGCEVSEGELRAAVQELIA
jgi:shikimate kinase/3-dehydroquinate synthase